MTQDTDELASLPDGVDHYDRRAFEGVREGERLNITALRTLYKDAGVLDDEKITDRLRRVSRLGVIEEEGRRVWTVSRGGDQ